jgi:hypothetical protein
MKPSGTGSIAPKSIACKSFLANDAINNAREMEAIPPIMPISTARLNELISPW